MDVDLLKEVLDYNPDTGMFKWKVRGPHLFDSPKRAEYWNRRWAGRGALTSKTKFGHCQGFVMGVHVLAHRAAIAIHSGVFPTMDVDHINGDPSDNRASNLRVVGKSRNQKNRKANSNNSSGFSGVYWRKSHGRWCGSFRHKGKSIHVGYFDCPSEAYDAVTAEREKYGFTERHGK